MVFQPFLIALAAGVALVAARIWIGRGGALGAARVLPRRARRHRLLVGPRARRDHARACRCTSARRSASRSPRSPSPRRPLAFGAVGGVAGRHGRLRGRVGAGRRSSMPLPWTRDLLPEARRRRRRGAASPAALVGALLGAGPARRAAAPGRRRARSRPPRWPSSARCSRYGLHDDRCPSDRRATVELTDVARRRSRAGQRAPCGSPGRARPTTPAG